MSPDDEKINEPSTVEPDEETKEEEPPVHSVVEGSGGFRIGNAKVPPFLLVTYLVLAIWAFGYGMMAVPLNQTAETAADGEAIFEQSCLGCHSITDEPKVGPGLEDVHLKYTEEELQLILVNGIGEMPSLPALGLNTEQIKAVKDYIQTL
ncbi:cytochrome c [Salipaludibacillus sp. CUR1]|uniref:c-type cytochrome n=1 Tax=Salipaludibacillus sp. CUR1 TaxID=2820003 RepID=UPI001E4D7A99|nr:cytochrome c [Salipaludibacillus sp. CUR1]MCE7793416.1 cytochrome c [Salipaludibacillus sp. CUR1]